jgi:hypothetical protein
MTLFPQTPGAKVRCPVRRQLGCHIVQLRRRHQVEFSIEQEKRRHWRFQNPHGRSRA